MPDNSFTVGATVDVSQLAAGMNEAGEVTQEALDKMLVSFSEASTGTARAVSRITDETRIAAVSVDESWQRMAKASLDYTASLKEVSAATYLARKAGADDAAATNLLAAAKEKAAAASAELAAAQAATVATTEAESFSMKELGASMSGAFSEILGVTLGVDMLVHSADRVIEFNLQMRNLSLVTGISISTLAGLHDAVKEMGGDFDPVAVGLSKMGKAQHDAMAGMTAAIDGFKLIGISVKELRALTPEELLFRVARGFAATASSADKNAAAIDIFGRGGRSLIAMFAALGPQIQQHVADEAKVSGVTKESADQMARYNDALEEVSIAWRRFATAAMPIVLGTLEEIGTAMEALVSVVLEALNAIGAAILSVLHGLRGIGAVIYDVVTGNFSAIVGDAKSAAVKVGDEWKGVADSIDERWKSLRDGFAHPLGGNLPAPPQMLKGDDLPSGDAMGKKGKAGHDTRLDEWRTELQAKRDSETNFHELSKADEAKFWADKLFIAQDNAKLAGEVYHQMREAERAAAKDGLKEDESLVQQRVAATKQGSAERVTILQEEVNHLKSIRADETSEFKHAQTELVLASKAYAEAQGKYVVEQERRKVEATRKSSEERVAAERAVLAELASLHLQDTSEYTAQLAKIDEAEKAAAAERVKLLELNIEQARIAGLAKVQIERQNVQAEFDLHLINAQQRIAALKELEDREYEIAKTAIEKKLALALQDPLTSPVRIKELQNQIVNLTREFNDKIAALNTQGVKDSMQKFDQFFSHVTSGFQTAINGWLQGTQTFGRAMAGLWNSMAMAYVESLEKMLVAHLQHEVAKLAAHTAEAQAEVGVTAAAEGQKDTIGILADLKSIGRAAATAAAHAFKWVMQDVPFPLNAVLAPAAAAATFASVIAFRGLASAAGGMEVPQDMIAQVHKNEMVLPASLSQGFKSIIGSMGPAGAPGAAGGAGGSGASASGSVTHNHHYNVTVNAGSDRGEMLSMVEDALVPMIRSASRRGLLPST